MKEYPQYINPYAVVGDFEQRVSDWAGAKYGVATDSCTSAIFLSLQWRKYEGCDIVNVLIPAHTYPSVPCSLIHSGFKPIFDKFKKWEGEYELFRLNIWDAALRFKKGMYHGGLQCLSFHIKKHLPIGRGGLILTDDINARDWLRKARFDGRNPVPLLEDDFTMLGYNCYMTPEQAARGIQLFEVMRQKHPNGMDDLVVAEQGYPDLSKYPIYTQ